MGEYEVIMDGGGPWGIRLQGGKDFGVPLNVARVTPGSKAAGKGIMAGDQIVEINSHETDTLTHMDAQNLIKSAGNRLQMLLRKGIGASLGEIKQVGSGALAAEPKKTLYTTDVTHSAGVDHKYNAKPKAFISGGGSVGETTHVREPVKRFDPKEYARRKKEELEKYKEDQSRPIDNNSEVLKALQKANINDEKQSSAGSFSKLEKQLANEGQPMPADCAFRMTAEGTDLNDVSPGSRIVMDDIKAHGASLLTSNRDNATGGSRSFKLLQNLTSMDEDLPPPPPELMDDDEPKQVQSHTFRMLQQHVDSGLGDTIKTAFDQSPNERGQSIAAPAPQLNRPNPRADPLRNATTVNPMPKAPMPTGPNFRVGRVSAPTFKPSNVSSVGYKPPPPPAVNAGEIVNPNSKLYQSGAYPNAEAQPSHPPAPQPTNLTSYSFAPQPPAPPSSYTAPYGARKPSDHSTPYGVRKPSDPIAPYGARKPSDPSPPHGARKPDSHAPPSQSGEKKLICSSCQQPLGGPFVSAIGKTWHPEHFCCSSCHTSLQNQAFVEENDNLFCEKCYNQYYAPKCAHCNQAIIGDYGNANEVMCKLCASVAASDDLDDPVACYKSINWLLQQTKEANSAYEAAVRKKHKANEHWTLTKRKIHTLKKQLSLNEHKLEENEKKCEALSKAIIYKHKICTVNNNLCARTRDFDERIQIAEKNLQASRERLNGWRAKLSTVMEDYKAKRSRLSDILRRQKETPIWMKELEDDLANMNERIKVLNGKKAFRQVKFEVSMSELNSIENEINIAESRQMLCEQHVRSLNLYREAIENEYREQQTRTLDILRQYQALALTKK